jgi:hypothetical protein
VNDVLSLLDSLLFATNKRGKSVDVHFCVLHLLLETLNDCLFLVQKGLALLHLFGEVLELIPHLLVLFGLFFFLLLQQQNVLLNLLFPVL